MNYRLLIFAFSLVTGLTGIGYAQVVDTDGDGLLDLIDVPGFPLDDGIYWGLSIEDLDGASLLVDATILQLETNRLASIERGDFEGLSKLQELHLNANQITSIEPGDFEGLTALEFLNLGDNPIASIETGSFEELASLKALGIYDSRLTAIDNGDFNRASSLQSLHVSENPIATIETGSFEGLENLRELVLDGNRITSVESGDFSGLTNLLGLGLEGNLISTIAPNGFRGVPLLEGLSLNDNQLTTIESGAFDGLPRLLAVRLDRNVISAIEPSGFRGLPRLDSLSLLDNQITSIEPGDFDGLTRLAGLGLQRNQIQQIDADDFQGLGNLRDLWLTDNEIVTIAPGAFEELVDLRELHLSRNRIESMTLRDLPGLWELHLYQNQIASVGDLELQGLTSLRRLGLEHNQITSIERRDFEGLDSLEQIRLDDNQIEIIEAGAFSNMTLDFIGLTGNDFTHLDLTGATFDGFRVSRIVQFDDDDVTELTLDDVKFRFGMADLAEQATAVTQASIVGMNAQTQDVTALLVTTLLELESLTDITVDQGLVDLQPGEFTAFAAQETSTFTMIHYGDTNQDRRVDLLDFQVLADNFGQAGRWSNGDFDRDELITFDDFVLLAANVNSEPIQNVPEPRGLGPLLGFLTILTLLRRIGSDLTLVIGVRCEPEQDEGVRLSGFETIRVSAHSAMQNSVHLMSVCRIWWSPGRCWTKQPSARSVGLPGKPSRIISQAALPCELLVLGCPWYVWERPHRHGNVRTCCRPNTHFTHSHADLFGRISSSSGGSRAYPSNAIDSFTQTMT